MAVDLRTSLNNGINLGLRQSLSAVVAASSSLAFLEYTTTSSTSSFTLRSTGTVDYEVDWGDDTTQSYTTGNPTHTYSTAGEYTIKITPAVGSTYRPFFDDNSSDTKIASISGTGGSQLGTNLSDAWKGATNMTSFSSEIDTSGVTSFSYAWQTCNDLTSFPQIDTSSGTIFTAAWNGCNELASFPALDFSSATTFGNAWRDCSVLATYPANVFDSTGTLSPFAFSGSWRNCALSAQSIENILTSLDANGASNVSLGINGGNNASKTTWSSAANTAYTNLINKGWSISYNA